MRGALLVPILCLASPGCFGGGCGPGGPEEPAYCDRFAAGMDWSAAVPREVAAGSGKGDSFVPYTDGGDVELVAGAQGAYMIMPVIRVAADGAGEVACWEVVLRNTAEGVGELPELGGSYLFDRVGAHFYSDPLFDQLVYSAEEVRGRTLTLDVTLIAESATVTQTVGIVPR